jgi:hypothetical protein
MEMSGQLFAPGRFTPSERAPGTTHWIGGWMGLRTGMDTVSKRNTSHRDSNPDHPIVQPVVSRYTDWAIRALNNNNNNNNNKKKKKKKKMPTISTFIP